MEKIKQNEQNKNQSDKEDNFSDISNPGSEDMNDMILSLEEDLLIQSQIILKDQSILGFEQSEQDIKRREKADQYFQLEHNLQKQHLEKKEEIQVNQELNQIVDQLSVGRIFNRQKSKTIDQKPDDQYDEYIVKKNDTIFGLALNLNISEILIKKLNNISDNIYPGQLLKLPKQKNESIQEKNQELKSFDDQEMDKINENRGRKGNKQGLQSFLGVNYFDLVDLNNRKNKFYKHIHAFYCTKDQGNIAGILRVTDDMIMFDPDLSRLVKNDNYYYKYQATVEIRDIHNCELVNANELQQQGQQDDFAKNIIGNQSILQLSLYTTGNQELEKKYASKLKTMRKQGKPIVVIFFMSNTSELQGHQKDQKQIKENKSDLRKQQANKSQKEHKSKSFDQEQILFKYKQDLIEIKEHINHVAKQYQVDFDEDQEFIENIQLDYDQDDDDDEIDDKNGLPLQKQISNQNINQQENQGPSLTRVTLYDIISKNFYGNKQRINNLWKNLIFLPKMVGPHQSQIMNQKQFLQILIKFPNQFRCNNWQMIYGNKSHGFSFSTFINCVRDQYPIFIVIKEIGGGNLFGAYISCPLNKVDKIQGDAETFVFTMNGENNKNNIVKAYNWSEKNSNFFHVYNELIIGVGKDSALFIDRNLKNGHSFACDTFDSPQLSHKRNFQIKLMEVWGLAY